MGVILEELINALKGDIGGWRLYNNHPSQKQIIDRINHLVRIERVTMMTFEEGCTCGSNSIAGSHHDKRCPVRRRFEALQNECE